jgi:hypothetical protein
MTMIHRTALFVGVVLAAAGVVMLVGTSDTFSGEAISWALRLWPLAIIALGVGLLLRRTRLAIAGTLVAATLLGVVIGGAVVAAPDVTHRLCLDRDGAALPTRQGTFTSQATIDLSSACGDVSVTTVEGSAWTFDALDLGPRSASVTSGSDSLTIRADRDGWRGGGFDPDGDDWRLALPRAVVMDLTAELNAGRGTFDLAGAQLADVALEVNAGEARLDLTDATTGTLDVEVNAGAATVLLSATSDLTGELDVAAGAIEICAPADLGLRIRGSAEFGRTDFNGLMRVGDAWETPDLATATHVAELSVSAQAGSVVVNPAGGCK